MELHNAPPNLIWLPEASTIRGKCIPCYLKLKCENSFMLPELVLKHNVKTTQSWQFPAINPREGWWISVLWKGVNRLIKQKQTYSIIQKHVKNQENKWSLNNLSQQIVLFKQFSVFNVLIIPKAFLFLTSFSISLGNTVKHLLQKRKFSVHCNYLQLPLLTSISGFSMCKRLFAKPVLPPTLPPLPVCPRNNTYN